MLVPFLTGGALAQGLNSIAGILKGRRDDTQLVLGAYRDLTAALQADIKSLMSRMVVLERLVDDTRLEVLEAERKCQGKLDQLLARPSPPPNE